VPRKRPISADRSIPATARPEEPPSGKLINKVQFNPPRDTVQEPLARDPRGKPKPAIRTAKYKTNRRGNPDANTKTCSDSNANANVSHRRTDTRTANTNEYAQRRAATPSVKSLLLVGTPPGYSSSA
jgi:hypothetical protein